MVAIFNIEIDATAYSQKIHDYLLNNRPEYNADRWSLPERSADGLTWLIKCPIEQEVQKWPVPINTSYELNKAIDQTIELPPVGQLVIKGKYYLYNGNILKCRQAHNRTIYEPKDTPALFSFFRDNSDQLEWIVGEQVEVGWMRIYNSIKYEVVQAHQTQSDWTPTATLNVLWKVYVDPTIEVIPVWVQPTGAHDAYRLGAKVHYPTINDPVYESLIDYNVYSPVAYPQGWRKL